MEIVIVLFLGVYGVLSIILFFKVWELCNDVRTITNNIDHEFDIEAKFNFLMSIGEIEKAKELIISNILSNGKIFDGAKSSYQHKINLINQNYGAALNSLGIYF